MILVNKGTNYSRVPCRTLFVISFAQALCLIFDQRLPFLLLWVIYWVQWSMTQDYFTFSVPLHVGWSKDCNGSLSLFCLCLFGLWVCRSHCRSLSESLSSLSTFLLPCVRVKCFLRIYCLLLFLSFIILLFFVFCFLSFLTLLVNNLFLSFIRCRKGHGSTKGLYKNVTLITLKLFN